MIRTMLYNPATKTTLSGGRELIPQWRDSEQLLWVDLAGEANDTELNFLKTEFGILESVILSERFFITRHNDESKCIGHLWNLCLPRVPAASTRQTHRQSLP
jgi:hypothetical protein